MSETRRFLEALVRHAEDDSGNLTVVSFAEGWPPKVWSVPPSEVGAAVEAVAAWNAEPGRNVYWSAGLRRSDLPPGYRGGSADVTAMLAIVVDVDNPAAAASWEDKALGLLPSAVIRTSFSPDPRYQLVYLLREPETDLDAWERAARKLEHHFGADHCSKDRAHVWRVPGTMNYPNAKKRAAGRVAELAVMVSFDESRRYDLSDFDDLPDPPAAAVSVEDIQAATLASCTMPWETAGEILACLPGWLQGKILENDIHTDGRSTFDWQVAKECARAGLNAADLCALYHLSANELFASKWREKEMQRPGAGDAYLMRTFAKARIEAEREGPLPETPDLSHLDTSYEPGPFADEQQAVVDWGDGLWTVRDALSEEDKEVEYWIFPWLQKGAVHCVHGPTGAGKSHFVGHQLYGLAIGKSVGPFHCTGKARVLYIDGEMGVRTINRRTRGLVRAYDDPNNPDPDGNFIHWSPYRFPKGIDVQVNLLDPEHQQRILLLIEKAKAEVVVFDNIRTLTMGLQENEMNGWQVLNNFWCKLRQYGLTVIWVHHDNKGKEDGTYSGNTNAMSVTEVQIPLKKVPESRRQEMELFVSQVTNGKAVVKEAVYVDLAHGKNRERDLSIHRKTELIYAHWIDGETVADDRVVMRGWPTQETLQKELGLLSRKEQVWGYANGWGTMGECLSEREIAKRTGISKTTVSRYIKEIDADPAAQARVRAAIEGKWFTA